MSDQKIIEPKGVNAVGRALQILDCFRVDDAFVSLADISRRTKIHKTTVLRLARTLADSQYLVQRDQDGAWRLGPAAGWLGARYQASFDVNNAIEPALLELTQKTKESTSFLFAKVTSEHAYLGLKDHNPFDTTFEREKYCHLRKALPEECY